MIDPIPGPPLFVSVFAYVLGKEVEDPRAAVAEEIALGERASWPAFRTLARIRAHAGAVQVWASHSSLIAKARSLALGAFLESGASRWVAIDDDVEGFDDDVRLLLDARDVDVLVAPCALRKAAVPALNIAVFGDGAQVRKAGEVRVFNVEAAGMALSVMTRDAAEVLYREFPSLRFIDRERGQRGLGVFLEEVRDGAWIGEDASFCRRVRASGLRLEALCDAAVEHAGLRATVDPRFFGAAGPGTIAG